MPTAIDFEYSVTILDFMNLQKVASRGTGVDICDAGMGFLTDYPLEPGHVLKIDKVRGPAQPFLVKWVKDFSGKYRVGGMFL